MPGCCGKDVYCSPTQNIISSSSVAPPQHCFMITDVRVPHLALVLLCATNPGNWTTTGSAKLASGSELAQLLDLAAPKSLKARM